MNDEGTVELFRPTGPKELALIAETGYTRFPPRLSWQPIFYPVLNQEYATEIARDWNAKDPQADYSGYVLRFHVRRSFLDGYETHRVGGRRHEEYWIPAAELEQFNANIIGKIEVIAEFHGDRA